MCSEVTALQCTSYFITDNWRTELQKYIAPDQLPVVFGGTCCDPDPQCTNFVSYLL